MRIATHVATYEPRNDTTAAGTQGRQVARFYFGVDPIVRERPFSGTATHVMRVAMWENDYVTVVQLGRLSVKQLDHGPAIDNQVVEHDEVLGSHAGSGRPSFSPGEP